MYLKTYFFGSYQNIFCKCLDRKTKEDKRKGGASTEETNGCC